MATNLTIERYCELGDYIPLMFARIRITQASGAVLKYISEERIYTANTSNYKKSRRAMYDAAHHSMAGEGGFGLYRR